MREKKLKVHHHIAFISIYDKIPQFWNTNCKYFVINQEIYNTLNLETCNQGLWHKFGLSKFIRKIFHTVLEKSVLL